MVSEKSLANLRPPKLGERRNPKGRPKKADCLIECIKSELSSKALNGISTKEEIIAGILVDKAQRGDLKAIELLMSYTCIKPTQEIGLTTKGKLELLVRWDGNREAPKIS